jgi:hypothetical protein
MSLFEVATMQADDQCELGSTVGYAIRFEDCTSKDTKIKCEAFPVESRRVWRLIRQT